jgi:hypothetical protein
MLKENNYRSVFFHTFDPRESHQVLIRHDIDFHPSSILGAIEVGLNFHSTFFFMLTSKYYNVMSDSVQNTIKLLRSFGHEIGYHWDYLSSIQPGIPIVNDFLPMFKAYSNHRPGKHGLSQWNDAFFLEWTYDKKFSKDIKYISDSNREWKHGNPIKEIPNLKGENFQLLIHPIWWTKNPTKASEQAYNKEVEKYDKRYEN